MNKMKPNTNIKKKRKKEFDTLKAFFIFLGVFTLILSAFSIYDWYQDKNYEVPGVEELKNKKEEIGYSDKDDNEQFLIDAPYVNNLPNVRNQYGNNDIQAKLEIPGLEIDTYVTRTVNNEYYLDHSIYKQKDGIGYPFIDYRNVDLKNAKQINIYGHNSQVESLHDKLELINLRAYLDKNFFDNYKYMYLSIDDGKYKYRVEAVKIVTAADPEHMKVIFFSDADFVNHTRKLYQNTTYIREDTKVSKDDKLLILQICNYNPQNSYLIIIGKQV